MASPAIIIKKTANLPLTNALVAHREAIPGANSKAETVLKIDKHKIPVQRISKLLLQQALRIVRPPPTNKVIVSRNKQIKSGEINAGLGDIEISDPKGKTKIRGNNHDR